MTEDSNAVPLGASSESTCRSNSTFPAGFMRWSTRSCQACQGSPFISAVDSGTLAVPIYLHHRPRTTQSVAVTDQATAVHASDIMIDAESLPHTQRGIDGEATGAWLHDDVQHGRARDFAAFHSTGSVTRKGRC